MLPSTLIFFSTGEIAIPLFQNLLQDPRFKILGLVLQPDRSSGRSLEVQVHPIKQIALENNISVYQPEKLSKDLELLASLKKDRPDFILTFSYGQILSESWLELPRIAPLNVHPSLLPKYRGPTPLQSALLHGEVETGVTLMKMSKGMDEGPIAAQYKLRIEPTMTSELLYKAAAELSAKQLPDAILDVAAKGDAAFINQDESKASYCSMIEREDGRVDFNHTADEIYNQFRAFTPWPGIFTEYKGKRLKMLEIEKSEKSLRPGEVSCEKSSVFIGCKDGSLKINSLQLEGKKTMDVKSFNLGQPDFCSTVLPS